VKNGAVTSSLPEIPAGTKAVRGAHTATETQIRTEPFAAIPPSDKYYVQKTIIETEQSTWFTRNDKFVKWDKSDISQEALFESKNTFNVDFWLGKSGVQYVKNQYNDNKKDLCYFMEGVWWQAGKEFELPDVVTTNVLSSLMKYIFTGNASSNTKYMFAGADVIQAFQNAQYNTVIYPGETYKAMGVVFSSIIYFGGKQLYLTHDPSLDVLGMSDCAMVLDEDYAYEYNFGTRAYTYDNAAMGRRDSLSDVIIDEKTYILANKAAHCRIRMTSSAAA
jgi:hypothetical protein